MIHRAAAALLVALLAVGCSEDAKHTLTPPDGPDYLANDSEDNLAHNFELAIEALDIDGYEALLYDGEPLASDGLAHGEYRFIFADVSGGPTLPDYLDRAAELLLDHADALGELLVVDLAQDDVPPRLGADLRDPVAHEATANDSNLADRHLSLEAFRSRVLVRRRTLAGWAFFRSS